MDLSSFAQWRAAALVAVGAVAFTGCGGGSPDESGGGSTEYGGSDGAASGYSAPPSSTDRSVPPTSASADYTHQTARGDCRDPRYPYPLTVQAEFVDEVGSLSFIAACTNAAGNSTWLGNRSDIVWRIYAGPVGFRHSPRTTAQEVVESVAGNVALMEPSSGVEVIAPPSEVKWYSDPALTAVFASTVELEKKARETAIENLPNVLREGTRRRARVTCGVAVYNAAVAANEVNKAKSDDERASAMVEGTESVFSSATDCRTAIREADAEQLRTRQISRGVLPELDATPKQLRFQAVAQPVRKSLPLAGTFLRKLFRS